uniref:Uncharacterized protein n=1 Tax=Anopheles aquasalis TaxID=42839 RepID=T1DGW4_ANOAQ
MLIIFAASRHVHRQRASVATSSFHLFGVLASSPGRPAGRLVGLVAFGILFVLNYRLDAKLFLHASQPAGRRKGA